MSFRIPVFTAISAMINPSGYPSVVSTSESNEAIENIVKKTSDDDRKSSNNNQVMQINYVETLDRRVHRAWMKLSPDVAKKKNPIPSSTKEFLLFCLIVSSCVAIAKVIMGLIFIDKCPTRSAKLPMFQYVGGILELLFLTTLRFRKLWFTTIFQIPLGIVMFIWFLISSSFIFIEYEPDYFKSGRRYCEFSFFRFCLIIQLSEFILYILLLLYVCIRFGFYN